MAGDFYIKLQQMSVGYHGKPLIREIDLGIKKGEIVTMIGPNGAGKSTILKSIIRQLPLLGGKVLYDGKDLKTFTFQSLSKKMAVVLTDRIRPELMTCHDVVATGRYPYTGRLGILSAEDEKKVDEALRLVHAEEFGPSDFRSVSDGQKQRILLARAICQEPEFLILDEPTSFLDIRHKLELLSILRSMAKEKEITVLCSLHEIDLAMKFSDRILCVKGEYLTLYGDPDEIYTEERIRELYELRQGAYDPLFGSLELAAPSGEPKTLVLSSGGSGIPVYRLLQKKQQPFIAGILSENDIDFRLARILAGKVLTAPAFEEYSDEVIRKAITEAEKADQVIATDFPIGFVNHRIREVFVAAEQMKKLTWKHKIPHKIT